MRRFWPLLRGFSDALKRLKQLLLLLSVCEVDLIAYSIFVLSNSTNSDDGAATMIAQIIPLPLVTVVEQSLRPFIFRCPFTFSFQVVHYSTIIIFSFVLVIALLVFLDPMEFCVLPTD